MLERPLFIDTPNTLDDLHSANTVMDSEAERLYALALERRLAWFEKKLDEYADQKFSLDRDLAALRESSVPREVAAKAVSQCARDHGWMVSRAGANDYIKQQLAPHADAGRETKETNDA